MPRSSSDKLLLSHPFNCAGTFAPFGRLDLFADRIERRAMGRVQERIALSDIHTVHWQTSDNDAPNFTLVMHSGKQVSGHLKGAGLWKTHLDQMLRAPRKTRRNADTAAAPAKSAA